MYDSCRHGASQRNRVAVLGLLIALVLTACGGGGSDAQDDRGGPGTEPGFGRPGDTAQAGRAVGVSMKDALQFEPASLTVRGGETVTFSITNTGALVHEFVLGNKGLQDEHESQMKGMTGGMSDTPNALAVEPGQTKALTWTFPDQPAVVLYGCHVPGHYSGGMKGTITVT